MPKRVLHYFLSLLKYTLNTSSSASISRSLVLSTAQLVEFVYSHYPNVLPLGSLQAWHRASTVTMPPRSFITSLLLNAMVWLWLRAVRQRRPPHTLFYSSNMLLAFMAKPPSLGFLIFLVLSSQSTLLNL